MPAGARHISELPDRELNALLLLFLRAFDGDLSDPEIEDLRSRCEGIVFLTDAEIDEWRQRCEGAAEIDPAILRIRDDMQAYRLKLAHSTPVATTPRACTHG